VSPDLDPTMLLHVMLSPAVSVSLFEERRLTDAELDSLVALVCRGTTPTGRVDGANEPPMTVTRSTKRAGTKRASG